MQNSCGDAFATEQDGDHAGTISAPTKGVWACPNKGAFSSSAHQFSLALVNQSGPVALIDFSTFDWSVVDQDLQGQCPLLEDDLMLWFSALIFGSPLRSAYDYSLKQIHVERRTTTENDRQDPYFLIYQTAHHFGRILRPSQGN